MGDMGSWYNSDYKVNWYTTSNTSLTSNTTSYAVPATLTPLVATYQSAVIQPPADPDSDDRAWLKRRVREVTEMSGIAA